MAESSRTLERLPQGWRAGSIGALGERNNYTALLIAGKARGAPASEGALPGPRLRFYNMA